jgi:hypothetical protein
MTLDLVDRMYIEVADDDSASRLTHRLARRRTAERLGEPARLVMASFSSDPADLAALLREVESWVDDESLCAIRFLLDDRIYVLEPARRTGRRTPGARRSRPSRRRPPSRSGS